MKPWLITVVAFLALASFRVSAAPLTEATLGKITVNVTEPEEYTPDDYGDKFMYHRLLTKRGQDYFLDVPQMIGTQVRTWGLFSASGPERLNLDVRMIELQDHATGMDVDVTMTMRYRLTDSAGRTILESDIQSSALATVGEYFSGATRSKVGVTRVVEANLAKYRQALQEALPRGLGTLLAETAPTRQPTAPSPPPTTATPTPTGFPAEPIDVRFKPGPERPDDIAVIIGNANYRKDIPDVMPAHADAEGFKRYALTALGIREGNIIDLRDATQAELISVFGSARSHKGKLFNWVHPGISKVVVYFAGHGAPGQDGSAYLVPVDADPSTLHLNGLKLDLLYANLAKIPAKSITVVLEACFSGASQAGSVISNASPVYLRSKSTTVPEGITVIAAGGPNQLASWEQDGRHSLFTSYLLRGISGEADADPHGNGDGQVKADELDRYLARTLTYYARRYYGRDQSARIIGPLQ